MGSTEGNNPAVPLAVASATGGGPVRPDYESKTDPNTRIGPEPPTYGDVSLRGAFWTIAFTVVNKVVSFASQIALAWFLFPSELGVAALALSISGMAAVLSAGGLLTLLVQRQGPIDDDAPQVFWLSLALGLAAMALIVAAAPAAGRLYDNPAVVPVMFVVSLCFPATTIGTIFQAKLMRDLKFKEVATINAAANLGKSVLSVAMAAAGSGAYAIVVPLALSQIAMSAAYRGASGRMPMGRPAPRLWPAMLLPTLWLTAHGMTYAIQAHGTNLVIGLFHDADVVGLYFWGFALSMQTMFLLATGLKDVLFPTLAKLNDQPERQAVGFRNALRLMMLVAAPAAVLQAVTADPLVKLLFERRWEPAIPVVRYLSFAMLSQPMQVMAMSLIMALGRFRLMTLVGFVQAVLLVGGTVLGAKLGAERQIAIWSGVGLLLGGLYAGYVAFAQLGQGMRGLIDSFWRTIVPSVASGLLAWGAALWARRYGNVAEIAVASVVLGLVYVPLACVFARADVAQLLVRLRMHRLATWLGPRVATEQ